MSSSSILEQLRIHACHMKDISNNTGCHGFVVEYTDRRPLILNPSGCFDTFYREQSKQVLGFLLDQNTDKIYALDRRGKKLGCIFMKYLYFRSEPELFPLLLLLI